MRECPSPQSCLQKPGPGLKSIWWGKIEARELSKTNFLIGTHKKKLKLPSPLSISNDAIPSSTDNYACVIIILFKFKRWLVSNNNLLQLSISLPLSLSVSVHIGRSLIEKKRKKEMILRVHKNLFVRSKFEQYIIVVPFMILIRYDFYFPIEHKHKILEVLHKKSESVNSIIITFSLEILCIEDFLDLNVLQWRSNYTILGGEDK